MKNSSNGSPIVTAGKQNNNEFSVKSALHFQPQIKLTVKDSFFDPTLFYQNMKKEFGGKAAGMGFAVCQPAKSPLIYQEGYRRKPADTPCAPFDVFETMHIASMSKTISAIALQKILHEKNISVDSSISAFLPGNWVKGPNTNKVTYRMLLTHTSGFRKDNCDFTSLKNMVATGVSSADQGVAVYKNTNFGLMRILIARMVHTSCPDSLIGIEYVNYITTNVTYPATYASGIGCSPSPIPTLYYNYNKPALAGWKTDDYTNSAGAFGWYLSVMEMACVMINLFSNEILLPQSVVQQMLSGQLGCYFKNDITQGGYYHHNGEWEDGAGRGCGGCWVYFQKTKHVVIIFMNSLPAAAMVPETVRTGL